MKYAVLIRLIKYDGEYETLFRGNDLSEEVLNIIIEKYAGLNVTIDVCNEEHEEEDLINRTDLLELIKEIINPADIDQYIVWCKMREVVDKLPSAYRKEVKNDRIN